MTFQNLLQIYYYIMEDPFKLMKTHKWEAEMKLLEVTVIFA
jgi:hypothetical protein